MEQLTIKELSPYLPYDINIMFNKKWKGTLIGLLGNKWNLAEIKFEFGNDRMDIEVCYPVLRPLSDLSKEIEINDEKFVPLEKLRLEGVEGIKIALNDSGITIHIDPDYSYCYASDIHDYITTKLLSWHFDIFSLIAKDLAVDYNTVK